MKKINALALVLVLLVAVAPLSAQTATAAEQKGQTSVQQQPDVATKKDVQNIQRSVNSTLNTKLKQLENTTANERKALGEEIQQKLSENAAAAEAQRRDDLLKAHEIELQRARTDSERNLLLIIFALAVLAYILYGVRKGRVRESRRVAEIERRETTSLPISSPANAPKDDRHTTAPEQQEVRYPEDPNRTLDPFHVLALGLPIADIEPVSERAVITYAAEKQWKEFVLFFHLKKENFYIPCIAEADVDKVLIRAKQNDTGARWKYRMDKAASALDAVRAMKTFGEQSADQTTPTIN